MKITIKNNRGKFASLDDLEAAEGSAENWELIISPEVKFCGTPAQILAFFKINAGDRCE